MARSPEYLLGFREASKRAVELLHEEAASMNDAHAQRLLDGAAFHVGNALKREYRKRLAQEPEDTGDSCD